MRAIKSGGGSGQTKPVRTITERNLPERTVALEEGAKVVSADDEHVGDIEQVLTDPQSDRVTHFIIKEGLLLKERKLIPTHWVSRLTEDRVKLAVGSDLLERLPQYPVLPINREYEVRLYDYYGRLRVVAWTRLGGLRLAPISFDMEQVDNPEATDAFVKELQTRKTSVTGAEALPGILDDWASWFATSLLLIIGLLVFVGLRQRDEAAQRDEVSEETARL
jgi:hypothetical protein